MTETDTKTKSETKCTQCGKSIEFEPLFIGEKEYKPAGLICQECDEKNSNPTFDELRRQIFKIQPDYKIDEPAREILTKIKSGLETQKLFSAKKPWLGLVGAPGLGKTTLAHGLMKIFKGKVIPYYVPGDQFRDHGQIGQDHLAALICFDDLGREDLIASHYGDKKKIMLEIFEHRYNARLRTMFTTNMDYAQLANKYGEHFASRISELSYVLTFSGDNRRLTMYEEL